MQKASNLLFIIAANREDVLEDLSCAQAGNQVKIERTWLFLAGGTKGEWVSG